MSAKLFKTIFALMLSAAILSSANFFTVKASVAPNPAKNPRMITLSFYGEDGTQMAFNWNTTDFTDSDVFIVEASDERGFDSPNLKKVRGDFYISKASVNDGFIHTAVASGLKLGTKYLYKVGDEELNVWSDVGSFTTESGDRSAFTFVHLSDPQADNSNFYAIYKGVLSEAAKNTSPRFFINTGDIVNNSWKDHTPILDQWEWSLTETFSVMKDYPLMATAGNHEAADNDFASRFNFDVPEGADTTSGLYYSYNYNNVHFIGLNTNDTLNKSTPEATGLSDAQISWLKSDLEKNKDAEWIVVSMHKGIYDVGTASHNTDGENYDIAVIRSQLAPLFTQYGVDLVLQGHDHLYSKTYPISVETSTDGTLSEKATQKETVKKSYNGNEVDFYTNPGGTIYINSGTASGWKKYAPVSGYNTEIFEKGDNGKVMYTAITVDGDKMVVNTYTVDEDFNSTLYNSFGIDKSQTTNQEITNPQSPQDSNNPDAMVVIVVCGIIAAIGIAILAIYLFKKKQIKK